VRGERGRTWHKKGNWRDANFQFIYPAQKTALSAQLDKGREEEGGELQCRIGERAKKKGDLYRVRKTQEYMREESTRLVLLRRRKTERKKKERWGAVLKKNLA